MEDETIAQSESDTFVFIFFWERSVYAHVCECMHAVVFAGCLLCTRERAASHMAEEEDGKGAESLPCQTKG